MALFIKNHFNRTLALTKKDGTTVRIKPREEVFLGEQSEVTNEMMGKQKLGILSIIEKNQPSKKKSKEE